MIIKSKLAVIITVLLLSAAFAFAVFGQRSRSGSEREASRELGSNSAPDNQWEYLVVSGGNTNITSMTSDQFSTMRKQPDGSFGREAFVLERNLDKLGAKGWELVSVQGNPNDPVYYLKRSKSTR
ncbi:MAG: hypothetical protein M3X11_23370 [Acidobacteriota bacterium]|nr:hypothetical protein [Acidobacteriota bacterium]